MVAWRFGFTGFSPIPCLGSHLENTNPKVGFARVLLDTKPGCTCWSDAHGTVSLAISDRVYHVCCCPTLQNTKDIWMKWSLTLGQPGYPRLSVTCTYLSGNMFGCIEGCGHRRAFLLHVLCTSLLKSNETFSIM
jgi:hypothetical protein